MKKHIRIMLCYFRLNLASSLEYRASFLTQALGMALSNSSFLFFWWIAFSNLGGTIAGYSFQDVMFLWAVMSGAYGVSNILFANASNLTRIIVSGELDAFLLQPCNVLVIMLCARTTLSAYGDLLYGVVLMCVAFWGDGTAWFWFFAAVAVGALLITAIQLTAHSVSFFVGDASTLGGLATEFMLNGSVYPEKMFGIGLRALIYSLIPAAFIVHIPLRLAREFTVGWAVLWVGVSALYCTAAAWLFYRGLFRYESGNVIVTRL